LLLIKVFKHILHWISTFIRKQLHNWRKECEECETKYATPENWSYHDRGWNCNHVKILWDYKSQNSLVNNVLPKNWTYDNEFLFIIFFLKFGIIPSIYIGMIITNNKILCLLVIAVWSYCAKTNIIYNLNILCNKLVQFNKIQVLMRFHDAPVNCNSTCRST
jgi:hypothetical protein